MRAQNKDSALMFEWFDRVGYDADIVGLRSNYPEVNWHRFIDWAREHRSSWAETRIEGGAALEPVNP